MTKPIFTRRTMLAATGAALSAPSVALAVETPQPILPQQPVRRNIMSFSTQRWQDHFESLGKGAILCDISSRALHFWSGDGETYKIYPSSVPRTDELTRRGYTEIVRKRVGPDWTPTPNMLKEDPTLEYMPPGPGNPLGTHAMYLTWPAYLIHGTHDTRKIGRLSSSGCIGLYNFAIEELFNMTPVGTQVRLL
ncbi:L,D-transpeptidase [uncultured Sulfitobacter sp.]|uniref:L,D-transpeptidase n=1 Tax=uncultured Sulfitobacter sp. TaxID=191468 RepID=UPI0026348220|nr:L,D-transpeptidase [uncultured Sulfitobacter sp.]